MNLDETMLQSNTAGELVKYIDTLFKAINKSYKCPKCCSESRIKGTFIYKVQQDYDNIKDLHAKAWKKRSRRYR